jgi:flagellar hook assembly protein FlgD
VALHQNVPNPFNPTTTISFTLPAKTLVDLTVFDVNGAFVTTVVHGVRDEGLTEAVWKGTNERGNPVASGVYFYRLKAGKTEITKKMVLLR